MTIATSTSRMWTIRLVRPCRFGCGVRRRGAGRGLSLATRTVRYNTPDQSTSRKRSIVELMTDIVLVLTTVPADDRAETIARTLVEDRLAACVNLHAPM